MRRKAADSDCPESEHALVLVIGLDARALGAVEQIVELEHRERDARLQLAHLGKGSGGARAVRQWFSFWFV